MTTIKPDPKPAAKAATIPAARRSSRATILLAWLAVGVPLAWGVAQTIVKSLALFG
jgi:hypothetical protein